MCGLRSDKPEREELRWCIVVDFDPMSPQVKGISTDQYCSVASISARGEGGTTERIFYHLTDNRPTATHGRGTISTEDAEMDSNQKSDWFLVVSTTQDVSLTDSNDRRIYSPTHRPYSEAVRPSRSGD